MIFYKHICSPSPLNMFIILPRTGLNKINIKDRVDRTSRLLKRRYLFVLFCFVFLPGLPRAADQNVCKQSWAAQAQLCYRKCLFPAKTEITASRPFNSLHLPAILFLVRSVKVFKIDKDIYFKHYDIL